jgi:hypothetical protein
MTYDQYWQEISERICKKCIDGDGTGGCRLAPDASCQIQVFLPEIVQTVANVHSDSLDPYVSALRRHVCILCDWERPDTTCARRNQLECALDRYFPLVVEAIETVKAKYEDIKEQ